jgi:GMP synthase-like glutamine amidotransferase
LKKILAVQNISCETLGTFEKMFRQDGFAVESIDAQQNVPADSSGYSAIVILGGPMAVYDNLPYLQKEQDLIRDAMKNSTPVLGVCLGSQLIAQAAGGRVYKGKKKEIGWHDVKLSEEGRAGLFSGVGEQKMRVFQWHGDTYDLPKDAKVLAYSDLYPQAFQIGSAVGIQFHLEVDEPMIKRWIKEYEAEVKAEKIDKNAILPKADDVSGLERKCEIVYRNFRALVTV